MFGLHFDMSFLPSAEIMTGYFIDGVALVGVTALCLVITEYLLPLRGIRLKPMAAYGPLMVLLAVGQYCCTTYSYLQWGVILQLLFLVMRVIQLPIIAAAHQENLCIYAGALANFILYLWYVWLGFTNFFVVMPGAVCLYLVLLFMITKRLAKKVI